MSSDDSDDEPLSVIAATKQKPFEIKTEIVEDIEKTDEPIAKRQKLLPNNVYYEQDMPSEIFTPVVMERSDGPDIWIGLKDLNPIGPYSCLLCAEWFINKTKIVMHYILNHKKDFCGICRYFVTSREAWHVHVKLHSPWQCSQCEEKFESQSLLKEHFSIVHNLVHCRFCYFRMPDNDQYLTHLQKKHHINDTLNKNIMPMWEIDYEGCATFKCLLCLKSDILSTNFFNHYVCYHRTTLKCISAMISGTDGTPFSIVGAHLTAQFLETQLKNPGKFGYIDCDQKVPLSDRASVQSNDSDTNSLLNALVPEIKQEILSDIEVDPSVKLKVEKLDEDHFDGEDSDENAIWKTYHGDIDFDVTSTELILLQRCCENYIEKSISDRNSETVTGLTEINYDSHKTDFIADFDCPMCESKYSTVIDFSSHIFKMHGVKIDFLYSCRICSANFETQNELNMHSTEELKDFDDLWICQFCDMEFENREDTRKHLTQHWDSIKLDNCFSPHLGFKCKYCPTLFWNEIDRELHQGRVHVKHKEDFYKCLQCSKTFSDKIFFIHHQVNNHPTCDISSLPFVFKCSICTGVIQDVKGMREHFAANHADDKKIFCSLESCQFKPFAQKKSFKIHIKTMHNPSPKKVNQPAACQLCGRMFENSRAVSAHVAQSHTRGRFKCKICAESMLTGDERKLHYLLRHPGRYPFECNVCNKTFQNKSSLYTHKAEHKANQQPFTCDFCNKVFSKRDSYREHLLIHSGPRHACSYCPMRFVQRSNMLRHERRHTGERPYRCHECDRTFADKGACSSHLRTHSRDRSFPCQYCGQTFVQKSKLTYHTRKHTGENLETCQICSKLFTSACSLREHMKTHNKNPNNVPCPVCGRKYRDERLLSRHLRMTHSGAAHSCPLCAKLFSNSPALRLHVLTHTKLKMFSCRVCPKQFSVKRSITKHIRRRHAAVLQPPVNQVKCHYVRLDPRECQLGLDEETMTKVFGPAKRRFLQPDTSTSTQEAQSSDDEDDEGTNEGDSNDDDEELAKEKVTQVNVKAEPESEDELEPTDFVSVKIEPLDEEEVE